MIGTSAIAFALKYLGHSVPEKWLTRPTIKRINMYIPIALLSALVAVQTFATKNEIGVDHRAAGLAVAFVALKLKATFPIVVVSAALTSALIYNFL